jgi:hypothetical protein
MSAPITYAGRTWSSAYEWCLSIMQHNAAPGPAQNGQRAALDAFRAEVLREAADIFVAACPDGTAEFAFPLCQCDAADDLRRMADEAGKAAGAGESTQPAELVIYRAEHETIVFGRYTNREAARAHCEALLRREVGDAVFLGWVPDHGGDDAPEELCLGEDVECTGYVVTPLTVASAYDQDGDE